MSYVPPHPIHPSFGFSPRCSPASSPQNSPGELLPIKAPQWSTSFNRTVGDTHQTQKLSAPLWARPDQVSGSGLASRSGPGTPAWFIPQDHQCRTILTRICLVVKQSFPSMATNIVKLVNDCIFTSIELQWSPWKRVSLIPCSSWEPSNKPDWFF